jgi:hypothetical protein
MLNRAAIILKYKAPAVRWINEADPYPPAHPITLETANQDPTVYLIDDADAETGAAFTRWLNQGYKALFAQELNGWYVDPALWPQDRSLRVFESWFDIELHTVLIDAGRGPIGDDGLSS